MRSRRCQTQTMRLRKLRTSKQRGRDISEEASSSSHWLPKLASCQKFFLRGGGLLDCQIFFSMGEAQACTSDFPSREPASGVQA